MTTNNSINLSSNVRNVYVSSTGSDTTGNGAIVYPYATVAHALSTITTASSVNPFTIVLVGGQISESSAVNLKPFVSISAPNSGTLWVQSAVIGLDSSWGTTSSGFIALNNFSFSTQDIILDFSSFTNATSHNIYINGLNSNGRSISVKGSANTVPNLFISDSVYFGSDVENGNLTLNSNIMSGNLIANVVVSPSINNTTINLFNNHISGNLDIRANSVSFNTVVNLIANKIDGTISGSGSTCTLNFDIVSYRTPTLSGSAVSNYGIIGVRNGSDAISGNVGEYFSQSELVGSAQPLSTGTPSNVFLTQNVLPPGDWDVYGTVIFNPDTTTTTTEVIAALSGNSATLPTLGADNNTTQLDASIPAGKPTVLNVGPVRASSAFIQTVFLVAQATFSVSTMSVYGCMTARRVR